MSQDIRTKAIVLHRTKYGETDRILNLLTPTGKISVIARGARKEKSKLAGGIELFCVSDVTIHQGKSDLATLTSAKMNAFYGNILSDLNRLELASSALKQANKLSEHLDTPELYNVLEQIFAALHKGANLPLVESYALLNFAKISGEEPNLIFDTTGEKLKPNQTYLWNTLDQSLEPHDQGPITTNHIKLLRLLLSAPLQVSLQVENTSPLLEDILYISKSVSHL